MNRRQKRVEQVRNQVGSSQSSRGPQVRRDEDSNEPQRSCDLDDDNDNLPLSQEIKDVPVTEHFCFLKFSNMMEEAILRSNSTASKPI